MTPRKPENIATPSIKKLQALFDLPSTPNPDAIKNDRIKYYNRSVIALDILFEQAASGSIEALETLRLSAEFLMVSAATPTSPI